MGKYKMFQATNQVFSDVLDGIFKWDWNARDFQAMKTDELDQKEKKKVFSPLDDHVWSRLITFSKKKHGLWEITWAIHHPTLCQFFLFHWCPRCLILEITGSQAPTKKLQGVGVAMKFLYKCGYYHSMRVDQYDVQSNGRLRIYRWIVGSSSCKIHSITQLSHGITVIRVVHRR